MSSAMKALFLNPPSFDDFDGGPGARWPLHTEVIRFMFPVSKRIKTNILA